jgi:hypothetical protein
MGTNMVTGRLNGWAVTNGLYVADLTTLNIHMNQQKAPKAKNM